jgi:hypothetical protein
MAVSINPLHEENTMSLLHQHPALSLRRRTTALAAAGTLAAALVAAGPAVAQPKGPITAKGCPVEDANGTTSTVAVGTRIGLFVCGSDGEWHFGWLINARTTAPPPHPGLQPVNPPRTLR